MSTSSEWPEPGVRGRRRALGNDDALAQRRGADRGGGAADSLSRRRRRARRRGSRSASRSRERSSLPTVMTLMGLGACRPTIRSSLGMLGMHGAPYTNHALDECDLLIAVGARFDDRATGKLAEFCPRASVIHVDIDAAELGKLRAPQLAIAADARAVLEPLLPRVRARRAHGVARAHPRAEAAASAPHAAARFAAQSLRPRRTPSRACSTTMRSSRPTSASTRCGSRRRIRCAAPRQLAHVRRPRHDGLRLAGGDRRRARCTQSARSCASRATARS